MKRRLLYAGLAALTVILIWHRRAVWRAVRALLARRGEKFDPRENFTACGQDLDPLQTAYRDATGYTDFDDGPLVRQDPPYTGTVAYGPWGTKPWALAMRRGPVTPRLSANGNDGPGARLPVGATLENTL